MINYATICQRQRVQVNAAVPAHSSITCHHLVKFDISLPFPPITMYINVFFNSIKQVGSLHHVHSLVNFCQCNTKHNTIMNVHQLAPFIALPFNV